VVTEMPYLMDNGEMLFVIPFAESSFIYMLSQENSNTFSLYQEPRISPFASPSPTPMPSPVAIMSTSDPSDVLRPTAAIAMPGISSIVIAGYCQSSGSPSSECNNAPFLAMYNLVTGVLSKAFWATCSLMFGCDFSRYNSNIAFGDLELVDFNQLQWTYCSNPFECMTNHVEIDHGQFYLQWQSKFASDITPMYTFSFGTLQHGFSMIAYGQWMTSLVLDTIVVATTDSINGQGLNGFFVQEHITEGQIDRIPTRTAFNVSRTACRTNRQPPTKSNQFFVSIKLFHSLRATQFLLLQ